MADPVEDDLRDRAGAVLVLIAGLVIDRVGETLERLGPGGRIPVEYESRGGGVGSVGERDLRIDLERLLRRDRLQDQRRRGRGCCVGCGPGRGVRNRQGPDRDEAHETEDSHSDRLPRIRADERPPALAPEKAGLLEAVERPGESQRNCHDD